MSVLPRISSSFDGKKEGAIPRTLQTPGTAHHRVGFNVFSNWIGTATSLVIGFLITPLMVHKLGDNSYGVWVLILQVSTYITILDLGVRITLTRYVTHYCAKNEIEQVHGVLSVALTVLATVGALSLVVTGVLVYFLPRIIHVPYGMESIARWTMVLVGLQVSISFPGTTFAGLLAGVSRYDLLNAGVIAFCVARGLLIWLVLARGHGVLAVALAYVITCVATYLLQFVLAWKVYGGFHFSLRRSQLDSMLRPLLNFSFFAFLLAISGRLVLWSDNIVVGIVLGPAIVTFYAIGGGLVDILQNVLSASMIALVPLATSYDARSEEEKLRALFSRGSRFVLLLLLPAIIGFLVLGAPFITLWMGSKYVAVASKVLILLAVPFLFAPMRATAHQILYGTNRHRFNAYASLSEAGVNLVLSIILAHRIGAVGVAWGTLIPAIVTSGVVIPVYTLRHLQMNWRDFYWDSWILPVLSGVPYMVLLYVLRSAGIASSWTGFFVAVIGSLPLYCFFTWFAVLKRPEKEIVRHQIRLAFDSVPSLPR